MEIPNRDKFTIGETVKDGLLVAREGSKAYEMLRAVEQHLKDETWNVGKLNRWIGYAQCLLVAEGSVQLDELIRKGRLLEEAAKEIE